MDETIDSQRVLKTTADYKAAIAEYMKEIEVMRAQSDRYQEEIDRLKGETATIMAGIDAKLAYLEERLRLLEASR